MMHPPVHRATVRHSGAPRSPLLLAMLVGGSLALLPALTGCRCAVAFSVADRAEATLEAGKVLEGNSIDGKIDTQLDGLGL